MTQTTPKRRRCAIYTRKSTEEGLELSFNSLDAQREACAAFILSQAHEGWKAIDELYDDGGFSGGSMDRPGLQQLMEDVEAGKIDIIVVYKVDRLTRSLADFARIVDTLDKRGASFVSVTQAFNTTNSMGRLTLNVLLSFAQFEREVTGERIRDKIAASKKRGMWMGGVVPLGFEVKDRKLLIVPEEAEKVRYIFNRYLGLGSVYLLQSDLAEQGIRTRKRILKDGRVYGGCNFSRGALYQMLANRIYLGEITHHGKSYPGEHDGIIDPETFEKVATRLSLNRVRRKYGEHAVQASVLAGIIWDGEGRRMTPDHASKKGQRYRYYASLKNKERPELRIHRLPASEIEKLVIHQLATKTEASWEGPIPSRELVLEYVEKVTVNSDRVDILFQGAAESITVEAPLIRCGGEVRIDAPGQDWAEARRDPPLIKLIVRAHQAKAAIEDPAVASVDTAAENLNVSKQYFCRLLRLAYLAPDITASIIDGKQPVHLNRQFMARVNNLPLDWASQREMLGFG
ncbi:recombinase family protein [Aurantiacibacter zhengii]|uniref:Recombinase family protein n=1 Tax=Aurantiacibacter zhengii TaxID=2307003 RepID=A0A418NNW5_9SPHN|nr:recombinase family protein [Aurantiacibacter zhengii]RIV83152.1 recombinase family protein [Aurantiacibacter zhengii]